MKERERKILVIYVYDNHHELVETTTRLLLAKGVKLDAICVSSFRYVKGTKTKWPWIIYLASFFINKIKIPKAQGFFHSICNNRLFRRLIDKYDLIDFQSFPSSQYSLAEYCADTNKEFLITFWGSDALRASDESLKAMKKSLDACKKIRLNNQIKQKLNSFYRETFGVDYESKYTGMVDGITSGNKDIFVLDSLTEEDIKRSGSIFCDHLTEKILVTIGYNGAVMQNQDRAIAMMTKLPDEIKRRIHVVFPMTYGASPEHLCHIRKLAAVSGISHTILDRFLTNKEICVLRKITNVFVMLQDTDGFAGSVRSHVYCQNVCLIGEWLDYPMEEAGVYYQKVNWDNLLAKFKNTILNYDVYHKMSMPNKEKMLPFMTWDRYVKFMCNLYK